ncbi:MAG: hypothetical protein K2K44_06485, partial [Oscillospiraceae bacterium]|nr:hypothetical protein [Oscillospiraceae bacterium]
IDKTYSEELAEAYAQSREVINQTERELRSFLGDNYKGSIPVNGLLSFCGLAVNADGSTSIVFDKDKSLRSDQKKYLNEYGGDRTAMLKDSNISEIQEIISEKAMGFEDYIYDENIKKLKSRLSEMIDRISELKKSESAKIGRFMGICNEFDSNCYNAKEDYIQSLRHIGHNAASDAFSGVKEDLFGMIERDGGKTKPKEIQRYFDEHKNQIINDIQNFINKKLNELQNDYDERIKDAVQRMAKDFDKEQTVFQVSLSSVNISIDESFADAFKYDMKTFGGDVFRVGSLALSGAGIGTLFAPGIGTAIGAVIGAIAGAVSYTHL